jgi:ankyrin repeat protein
MSRHNVVHGTRYHQQTVLHYAALSDNEEMLRLLLEHGADKTIADNDGTLPSELADNDRLRALLE